MSATADAEQPTLPRMPTRLFRCTPSRLAAFDCPRRYRFTYLDRPTPPRGPARAHSTLGAAVHVALSRWWELDVARRTPDAAAALVGRHWQRAGFRDDAHAERWRAVTQNWVLRYAADHLDPTAEPVGVERTVASRTEALAIEGRVDRIDDRCGELVVVDYKTGRRPCTTDDARGSQALALYVLAVRRTLRRVCRRVELHHIPTEQVAAFEHTDESIARHIARAEATAEDIVAATDTMHSGADPDDVFPPSPSPACAWCDFRSHCPDGRAASDDLVPWAGLAEEPEAN